MYNSLYQDLNKKMAKDFCYETYEVIVDNEPKEYEKVTRKQMLDECVQRYKEYPNLVNELFTAEELEKLYNLDPVVPFDRKLRPFIQFFLYCFDSKFEKLSLSKELKDVCIQSKESYFKNKEEIETSKIYAYMLCGIMRVYGALTPNEIWTLFNKMGQTFDIIDLLNYPYVKRFIHFDPFSRNNVVILRGLEGYGDELFETHPKNIRLRYTANQFVEIGIHHFIHDSPEYKELCKHPDAMDLVNSLDLDEFILWRGCDISGPSIGYKIKYTFQILNDVSKAAFITFIDQMSNYILEKNEDNILSEYEGNLFYKIMMPFISYAAKHYDLEFDFQDKRYNGLQAYEVLNKCIENQFDIVDNYIVEKALSTEEKQSLLGMKKFVKDRFIVLKHLKNGSVFLDSKDNMYLVKGIISPLEKMEGIDETPAICETFLIPFKDKIIYGSILMLHPIKIVGNLKKQYDDIYKKNKKYIITKL